MVSAFEESGYVAPMFGMMHVLKEFWTVLSNVKICHKIFQHRNKFLFRSYFLLFLDYAKDFFFVLHIENQKQLLRDDSNRSIRKTTK